jgi:AcrR family transcriptional regulator
MLSSAVQVVMEQGYRQMSVARVTDGAGVSRRTFYELFDDREACFLAAFDQAVAEMSATSAPAWRSKSNWHDQVRAALAVVLAFFDEHRGSALLLVVEALGAGPRVLAHRARLISQLAELVDEGRSETGKRRQPPPLTAEGIVGAVFSVIHSRLLAEPEVPLTSLLNPLMSMIVGPYLGGARATRELECATPLQAPRVASPSLGDPLEGLNMRITQRTLLALQAIHASPGSSNRQVADRAGIADPGQISKLLARLEGLGLVENTSPGQASGEPNQWLLTARGQQVQRATAGRAAHSGESR